MAHLQLTRPPRNDEELYHLVKTMWGITIPRHKVCPEHNAPFEAFATAFFAREPMVLIHGSRGLSGKSRLLSALGMTEATVLGADVNLLGGSLAQSTNILEAMHENWEHEHAPTFMQKDSTISRINLTNGAKIRPLTASQKTVRGPHPPRLLLDEIDEMDLPILDAALGQPMPRKNWLGITIPAQTTMSSTWQYPDGTFTAIRQRFVENELPIYTWCFKDTANPIDGWLTQEFIEQKKREIPREMWRVEYELGEPSIGNRAIDTESVERMFDVEPPKPVKKTREWQEYFLDDYHLDKDYVIAADWAKSQDWTVITVWDVTYEPIRLVYYVRFHRLPYPVMVGKFDALQKHYQAQGIHDATGLGGVITDLLSGKSRNFLMTGRQRDDMLSEYIGAVEHDKLRAARIPELYNANKYVSVEDMFNKGQEYHLPDEVCSCALAWKVVSKRFPLVEPVGLPKVRDDNWMARQVAYDKPHVGENSEWRLDGGVRDTTAEAQELFSFTN